VAEIFLRLGCALVAWLLAYAHGILLAVVPVADCSPALWRTTLLFAGLGAMAAALLPLGLRWRDSLRWLSVPAVPLLGYGAWVALTLWDGVGGASLCDVRSGAESAGPGEPWERVWAPIQLVVSVACAAQCARFWWKPSEDAAENVTE